MEGIHEYFIKNDEVVKIDKLSYLMDGEIIYEVLRIIDGVPLFLEDHYERLLKTFSKKGINNPITCEDLKKRLDLLCEKNNVELGNVKIIYPINEGNMYLFFITHSYPTEVMYRDGVKGIFFFAERNNPNEKVINNNLREKVNEKIKGEGAYEALLVDRENYITEGSRSNVFMIKGEVLITTPVDKVLPGVTRKNILELAKEKGIKVIEKRISLDEIKEMDEVFISGTSPKILPFKCLEEYNFAMKSNILNTLINGFNEKIKSYIVEN